MLDFLFWGFYNAMFKKNSTAVNRASIILANAEFFLIMALIFFIFHTYKPDFSANYAFLVIPMGYFIIFLNERYYVKKRHYLIVFEKYKHYNRNYKNLSIIFSIFFYLFSIGLTIYCGIGSYAR